MKKHFVIFCSPGTFVPEQSEKPIETWNVALATKMADDITERYGATPYGFYFTTRERGPDALDSKQSKKSNMYYLGGEIQTLAQVKARNDPNDEILISNMECNKWDRIVVNTNSWKMTKPLEEDDVILAYTPPRREAND